MYVNYYDRTENQPDENTTIGIILYADKNNTMVEYALPKHNSNILASKYQLYLPKKEALKKEFEKIMLDN